MRLTGVDNNGLPPFKQVGGKVILVLGTVLDDDEKLESVPLFEVQLCTHNKQTLCKTS